MSTVSVLGPTSAVRTGNVYVKDSASELSACHVKVLGWDGWVGESVRSGARCSVLLCADGKCHGRSGKGMSTIADFV